MDERRDERLAAALAELEAPEHRPGFWAHVEAKLAEARGAPTAFGSSARARAGRRRPPRRAIGLVVAAACAAVALALVLTLPDRSPLRPETATAAEVAREVQNALARARSLTGIVRLTGPVDESYGRFDDSWRFAVTAEGDYREEKIISPRQRALGRREALTYDARGGVAVQVSVPPRPARGAFATRHIGLPPGGPDPTFFVDFLRRDLAAAALALALAGDAQVDEITYRGRPAWRLEAQVRNDPLGPRGRLVAVIDRGTSLPVRILHRVGGRVTETRLGRLAVDTPIDRGRFTLRTPPGLPVETIDYGFRRTTLREAERAAGYPIVLPRELPAGFERAEVAVLTPERTCITRCDLTREPQPSGINADNPVAGPIVSVVYRRGLEEAAVTLRPTGPRRDLWEDPYTPGLVVRPERLRLRAGALRGARAEVVVDPETEPRLWAVGDDLVITVSGSLGRDELVHAAESLRRSTP